MIRVKNGIAVTIDESRKGWILMRGGLSYVQFRDAPSRLQGKVSSSEFLPAHLSDQMIAGESRAWTCLSDVIDVRPPTTFEELL